VSLLESKNRACSLKSRRPTCESGRRKKETARKARKKKKGTAYLFQGNGRARQRSRGDQTFLFSSKKRIGVTHRIKKKEKKKKKKEKKKTRRRWQKKTKTKNKQETKKEGITIF